MFNELNSIASVFKKSPIQAVSFLNQTTLSPLHPLSHSKFRAAKALLAQQTILAASALGLTSDQSTTQPPLTTIPSDISSTNQTTPITQLPPPTALNVPMDLPPPVNPNIDRALQLSPTTNLQDAGITTLQGTQAPGAYFRTSYL
jgi:hypothetical protein